MRAWRMSCLFIRYYTLKRSIEYFLYGAVGAADEVDARAECVKAAPVQVVDAFDGGVSGGKGLQGIDDVVVALVVEEDDVVRAVQDGVAIDGRSALEVLSPEHVLIASASVEEVAELAAGDVGLGNLLGVGGDVHVEALRDLARAAKEAGVAVGAFHYGCAVAVGDGGL